MKHRAKLTSPTGETFYICYDAPGMTPDPAAFWNSERASAAATRARMKGWKSEVEPVTVS